MSRVISTPNAPTGNAAGPFPFSQAVVAAGLVFVAGQGPLDPETGAIVGDTIQEQTRQAMRNVEAILEAAGSSTDRIVNVLFLLANPEDFAGLNEEWARWFPSDPPTRYGVKLGVDVPGLLVSIRMTAYTV